MKKRKEPIKKTFFFSLFGFLRPVKHTSAARFRRVATKTTHHKKTTTQNTLFTTTIYTKNGSHYHGISG
tara:strand:- start:9 stop:215 length:207 start_codon:yes stop_codon:yes gene_type:complete